MAAAQQPSFPIQIQSAFDEHHPPSPALIKECVHCGFCLPACPTYLLWREEMDSPRGRIYLMKMAAEGQVALDATFVAHMDRCLGCMACMTACPSGVQYDKLIEATRAQVERHHRRSFGERLHRAVIFWLFPHPSRLRFVAALLWAYQASGLRRLLHRSGLLRLLPRGVREMEALMPQVTPAMLRGDLPFRVPAVGERRLRVGMMLGCVQRVFFDQVNAATVRVLAAEGCEVVIPRSQGCCGALMAHAGREDRALDAARKLIDAFEGISLDAIVVNAAGCGSNVKEYGHLLRDDPAYAERARAFSAKCKDVSELLGELEPRAPRKPLRMRVAYHDSCHLQHAQGIRTQPRQLLRGIPEVELVELPEATTCCGSAGIYNLVQPETAQELGDRKAGHVLRSNADVLVSANPGCLLQIESALKRAGREMPSMHLIELLDRAIS